jgi:hypothetical protein
MKLLKYLLPIICGAFLPTVKADPVYTIVTGYGTYQITTETTSFAANAALLESMPWWGNVGLTYALSSTLNAEYGYNGTNLAVFAIGPAGGFAQAVDLNGNLVIDYSQAIAVNTNNPAIPYPYISDENPQDILPYVVLAGSSSSVPDTSSTLFMLSFALASGVLMRRQIARFFKPATA